MKEDSGVRNPCFMAQKKHCCGYILSVQHRFLNFLGLINGSNCVIQIVHFSRFVRGGADKSLALPGRKQAIATKLGIYSTYSPRSSIHFLARCSNFCKPLKKIQNFRPTRSPRQQWPPRQKKMATFQIFFISVQRIGGSPTGPDPENRVGAKHWKPR